MRVAVKEHRRRKREQVLTRTLRIEHVFTERLAWAAVHQRGGTHLADLWERMQPRGVLGGEVRRSPANCRGGSSVKTIHGKLAKHCGVVIPHHASGTAFAQQRNNLVRFGVVANHVAGVPNRCIGGNGIDVGEHRLQCGKIGMHVTEHGDLHGTLPATIAASAAQPRKKPEPPGAQQQQRWNANDQQQRVERLQPLLHLLPVLAECRTTANKGAVPDE